MGDSIGATPLRATHIRAGQPSLAPARGAAVLAREPFLFLVVALDALILAFRPWLFVRSDTWLALVGGRLVWRDGLPQHNTLTIWDGGHRWIDQQWLAQLLFYGVHAAGGLRLVLLVHVALLVGGFALALAFARRSGGSSRSVAIVGVIGLFVALPNSVARAQSVAYVLFVAMVWLLASQSRGSSRRVFLAVPLLVVWANVHGSAVLGAGLVVLWALAEAVDMSKHDATRARAARTRAALLAAAAPLCLLMTPYGFGTVGYYRDVFGAGAFRDLVAEWGPSTFPAQWPFFVLALAALWLAARKAVALTLFEHLALLATFVAGLSAVRNIVWFALVAAMVAPRALDALWPARQEPIRKRQNVALSIAATAVVVGAFAAAAVHPSGYYNKSYPDRAAAEVARATAKDPSIRVFSNEAFADWLLWRLPNLSGRVAFDARFELLTAEQLHAIAEFRRRTAAPSLAVTAGYRLLALDPHTEKPAIAAALSEPGARSLYRNADIAVILKGAAS